MASFYKRGDYQWEAKVRCTGHPMQSKTVGADRKLSHF
jgi:hypothetical protein